MSKPCSSFDYQVPPVSRFAHDLPPAGHFISFLSTFPLLVCERFDILIPIPSLRLSASLLLGQAEFRFFDSLCPHFIHCYAAHPLRHVEKPTLHLKGVGNSTIQTLFPPFSCPRVLRFRSFSTTLFFPIREGAFVWLPASLPPCSQDAEISSRLRSP